MKELLFIDFDGVICDSALECFVSSYAAHAELGGRPEPAAVGLERKKLFYRYRPLIRNGEDYLLIHELIDRGLSVSSQADFDAELAKAGPELMSLRKAAFYRAREKLLASDRDFWFGLNRLYRPLDGHLQRLADADGAFVLSTKKPEFIAAILAFFGISWPGQRLLYPGGRSKAELIRETLARERAGAGLFIDDHLGHLRQARASLPIKAYLAGWGYVLDEWLAQKEVEVLDLGGACALVDAFVEAGRV